MANINTYLNTGTQVAGIAGEYVENSDREKWLAANANSDVELQATKSVGGSALKGAAAGASIGTAIVPGVGTAIGGAVGAAGGAVMAEVQNKKINKQNKLATTHNRMNNIFLNNYDMQYSNTGNINEYAMGSFIGDGGISGNIANEYIGGGTHEQNPNGGIPVDKNGVPSIQSGNQAVAKTESGEFNLNNYVYSDRIKNPMTKKTFAKDAAKIKAKYKLREDEEMSTTSMNTELMALAKHQEDVRGKLGIDNKEGLDSLAKGGTIGGNNDSVYNPYGEGEPELRRSIMGPYANYNGIEVPRGSFPKDYTQYGEWGDNTDVYIPDDINLERDNSEYYEPEISRLEIPDDINLARNDPEDQEENMRLDNLARNNSQQVQNQGEVYNGDFSQNYYTDSMKRQSPGLVANLGASAYQYINSKPVNVNYDRYSPELVNYDPERKAIKREGVAVDAMTTDMIKNNAISGGNAISNIIASKNAIRTGVGDSITKSYMNEINTNVGLKNEARKINTAISNQEADARIDEEHMSRDKKGAAVYNAADATSSYLRDVSADSKERESMQMLGTENYTFENFNGSKSKRKVYTDSTSGVKYSTDDNGTTVYINPETGKPFANKTEFLKYRNENKK